VTAQVQGALHDDAVRVLSGWRPYEDGQDALRLEFLAHLAANEDGMWRECVPGHLTASAAVLDSSGERGDAALAGAALREAEEESGIEGLRLLPGPLRVDRHRVWCHGGSYHLDVQYAAVAPPGARERISDESDDLRWFPLDAIPDPADDVVRRLAAVSREAFARHA
jgi:8-oxo-dGTP pyrophosphatase MutT (NUDIX family)